MDIGTYSYVVRVFLWQLYHQHHQYGTIDSCRRHTNNTIQNIAKQYFYILS